MPGLCAGGVARLRGRSCVGDERLQLFDGGGSDSAVLIVPTDPGSVENTCYRFPLLPRAAPAPGALSYHALARRIGCVIPTLPEPEDEQP
jgi:hypothetical protein